MNHTRNPGTAKHEMRSRRKTPQKIKENALPVPRALILAIFLFWGIPNAHAQRFEITPFFGARFGGKVDLTQHADFMKIRSSSNYGVISDVSFFRHWQGEFMWSRQPTSLSAHNPNDQTFTYLTKMNLDTYQFGLVYQFRGPRAKLRPFLVFGVGFPHYGVAAINGKKPFAGSLGGGVKYYFTRNLGIRVDTRWLATETSFKETDLCSYGYYYIPEPCPVNNSANQGQVNVGLIFRFK
ncbi:MAG: porin family protein [Acidobacteriia bacterium]|nr:porin family protein [Terriglobia bacterium]